MAAGSSPSQAEWQADVHEVASMNFDTDKEPITGVDGKLPVSS